MKFWTAIVEGLGRLGRRDQGMEITLSEFPGQIEGGVPKPSGGGSETVLYESPICAGACGDLESRTFGTSSPAPDSMIGYSVKLP
eukprot:755416-Hanusia_phi.AAC.6